MRAEAPSRRRVVDPGLAALGAFFALATVAGRAYSGAADPEEPLWFVALLTLGLWVAYTLAVYAARAGVFWLARRERPAQPAFGSRAYHAVFGRYPVLVPFVLILLCWLPYVVILFPGTVDPYDCLDQICQVRGIPYRTSLWSDPVDPNVLLNNNNPVFHTLLLNGVIFFGEAIGSQNVGFFLITFGQVCLLAWALALVVALQEGLGSPRPFTVGLLVFFCVNPFVPVWGMCAAKDVLFSAITLHYVILAGRAVALPGRYARGRWLVLLFVLALLMMLVRNNGLFAMAFSVPAYLLVRNAGMRRMAVVVLAAIACYALYLFVLLPAMHVTPGSVRETLAIPLQQTARYARYHADDVTAEERAAINAVIDYDHAGELYDPYLVDFVKDTFNPHATSDDLQRYFGAWAAQGLRHPGTYLSATVAGTFLYYYPYHNSRIWVWTQFATRVTGESLADLYAEAGVYIHQIPALSDARDALKEAYAAYKATPANLLTNIGFVAWGILFLSLILAGKSTRRALIPFIPYLTLLLVCIACPENGNARYALPYVVAAPYLFTYAVGALRAARRGSASMGQEEGALQRRQGMGLPL